MTILQLRKIILAVLSIAVVAFTVAVFMLVQSIFQKFGPAVQQDLEWEAIRGAQDLARAADLGLAVSDKEQIEKAFDLYRGFGDVVAIVAVDTEMRTIATYGESPLTTKEMFGAAPGSLTRSTDHLTSWAPAQIEGTEVGRVGFVVTTRRLTEARALLDQISMATGLAGFLTLIFGLVFVNHFTKAVAERDAQLEQHAAGLERRVAERTLELDQRNRGMKLVLDNVDQGLVTLDPTGAVDSDYSAAFVRWFGVPTVQQTFADLIRPLDPRTADWFELCLLQLVEGAFPLELALDQMPMRVKAGERTLEIAYRPILAGERLERLLLVITDVTSRLEREQFDAEQRELVAIFQHVTADRAGFLEYFEDAAGIVDVLLRQGAECATEARLIHTLKGNSAVFGVQSLADTCHQIETKLEESITLDDQSRTILAQGWHQVSSRVQMFTGKTTKLELDESDYLRALELAGEDPATQVLRDFLASWRFEKISTRFARVAEHARALAARLGKGRLEIEIDTPDIRLDPSMWKQFWAAFVHAIRNAVDHGIESPEERSAGNKPSVATLVLSAERGTDGMVIKVEDDGRGIDWEAVRRRAVERGLAHQTEEDLTAALFAGRVSTASEVTTYSGRGVGMSALHAATTQSGGSIRVHSRPGLGTRLEFHFPAASTVRARPEPRAERRADARG